MRHHLKVTLRLLSLATILLLGLSGLALAQETTGRIGGQVLDPSGAIVDVNSHEKSLLQTLRNPRRNGG